MRYTPALLAALLAGVAIAAIEAPAATNEGVTISAGPEWVPLRPELDIASGSALDFSTMGLADAPAGKHGRVIATADGQFAFEKKPKELQRFYGVNLCFGAHYLSKPQAERLAERLHQLGYNALRIHHYERDLRDGQKPTTELNKEKLDQLDYLAAVLIERGIYLTTDLFVSRPVPYRQVGIERDGMIPMDTFKILVPVHEGAFQDWKTFARSFLTHINPYTQRSYAEEPALAWIAMINEGNFGNFFKDIRTIPEWTQAWNRWVTSRYPTRAALAKAWGAGLKEEEDPEKANVELPETVYGEGLRVRDCVAFLSDTEREMVQKMKRFLVEELGCRALISNASSWTRFVTDQSARDVYDYVDDHFYVDHPQWVDQPWRLPSRCANTSPLADGAPGGRTITFTRLFDKPFTLTEYNYSAPGRFRGVGGILTGALGSLQGWGGIWRFAYSHSANAMFTPSRMGYFDLASDPLSQAAERASLCLFLRGDLQMAPHSVVVAMTEADLKNPPARIPTLAPKWHWLAWITRVGTEVVAAPTDLRHNSTVIPLGWQTRPEEYRGRQVLALDPYKLDDQTLLQHLREKRIISAENTSRPGEKFYRSITGEITIDGPRNQLILDTPRTAGGFAPAGQSIRTEKGGVEFTIVGTDATLWVSALDKEPIRCSNRLLVTHLTDLQNTSIQYGEEERKTLLDWGQLPYLVRTGSAEVSINLETPGQYKVWALSPGGKRIGQVQTRVEKGRLQFTADVGADAEWGARMLYEVARK